MELNSMTIKTFIETARVLPSETSVLIRGPHGIGKSQIAAQLATYFGLPLIDQRLSQLTEGDMIGLPSTDGNVTRFNPPDWVKEACDSPRLLLLDELNRATQEVMQAAFQLVLDRRLQGWSLHPDTRVYAAINTGSDYNVNEVDPALLDRFFAIDLNATVDDWLLWATEQGLPDTVVEFIRENPKFLDPPKGASPERVSTSRRSWHRAANALKSAGVIDTPADSRFYYILVGYVGVDAAAACKDYGCTHCTLITGEDVLDHDYCKTNKDGVRTSKTYKRVTDLTVDKRSALIERVCSLIRERGPKVSKKNGENLKAFMRDLSKEYRLPMWAALNREPSEGATVGRRFDQAERNEYVINLHKHLVEVLVTDTFGVPLGQAGVGVKPNIPQCIQDAQAESK